MAASERNLNSLKTHGPGFPLIFLLPHISTQSLLGDKGQQETICRARVRQAPASSCRSSHVVTARVMAILSQLAIVIGLVLVGMRHFDNIKTGIAAATLYLLLPYTAMWTGSVTHALPGALLGVGGRDVSPAAVGRGDDRPGLRHDLLSDVPAAAVDQLLLAARAGADF